MFADISYGVEFSLDSDFRTLVTRNGTVKLNYKLNQRADVKAALISLIPDPSAGYTRVRIDSSLDEKDINILNWNTVDLENTKHLGKDGVPSQPFGMPINVDKQMKIHDSHEAYLKDVADLLKESPGKSQGIVNLMKEIKVWPEEPVWLDKPKEDNG
jgi:hypothetical protein